MLRRALAIKLKALGEDHPDTATSYNNLAAALLAQGKQAEAEAMHRRALAIDLKALGEGHPDTANSYNNLARILRAQGKQAEAEAMHRRALAIKLKALGEAHPDTAAGYNDLALTLANQGKHAEAEAMHRRALAIRRKALGEAHPDTATSYNNLAFTLAAQGKQAEAEAMLRHALAITLKALGEGHPDTATSYNNLAATLAAQGKHAEAEAMHRRALAIGLKALGEAHPDTAQATATWPLLSSFRESTMRPSGPGAWPRRATSRRGSWGPRGSRRRSAYGSPFPGLAAALARAGQPREAWSSWERGLARGIADEVTRRAARPLNDDERDREAALLGRGQAIDERINRLLACQGADPGPGEDPRRPPAAGQRDPPPVARPGAAVRGQVRRPGQPAGHARGGAEGPPRGDGPRRLGRHEDGPLGLPARPFRRPGLGPARRLRQGGDVDEG